MNGSPKKMQKIFILLFLGICHSNGNFIFDYIVFFDSVCFDFPRAVSFDPKGATFNSNGLAKTLYPCLLTGIFAISIMNINN